MGVKDSFKGARTLTIVTFVVALICNFCSWLSLTTTSWYVQELPNDANGDVHVGLWRQCRSKAITLCSSQDGTGDSVYVAIQALAVCGFVAVNIGFFLLILYMVWNSCKKSIEAGVVAGILLITGAACWIAAAVVFAIEFDQSGIQLHYSFGLAICAGILGLISGITIIVAARQDRT